LCIMIIRSWSIEIGTKAPRDGLGAWGKMLKLILAVIGFSLLCGAIPTLAAQSCEDWCQNRCAHRILSQIVCMNKCVPACQQKRGQDPRVRALPQ
jgi:hypothetical protein